MAISDKYRAAKPKTEFYSDFSTNLTPHPDTKDLVRMTNEEAIKRSIRNLVLTDEYERPFQPSIKSNVKRSLFENISPQAAEALRSSIRETVENHEPRANLIDVEVIANEDLNNYSCNITFYTINNPTPVLMSITLFRVR
jgi:phage baseplate assembly protein W